MINLRSRKHLLPLIIFIILDVLAVGLGMGVPFFAILLGFVVGWFSPSVLIDTASDVRHLLHMCLVADCVPAGLTFLLMLAIWGPFTRMLFDPSADLADFGIPMILYEPKASFIGWIVLMIIISPFLQALAASFASLARLAWFPPSSFREPVYLAGKDAKVE
jgi:hypothetical protein